MVRHVGASETLLQRLPAAPCRPLPPPVTLPYPTTTGPLTLPLPPFHTHQSHLNSPAETPTATPILYLSSLPTCRLHLATDTWTNTSHDISHFSVTSFNTFTRFHHRRPCQYTQHMSHFPCLHKLFTTPCSCLRHHRHPLLPFLPANKYKLFAETPKLQYNSP